MELLRCGKSSIKRSAFAPKSISAHRPPGNRAINVANLCVAGSFGNADNSAASFQGSRSSRASAERTLSGISFLSAPIGAYRKLLNSGLKKETEAAGVTMSTNHFSWSGIEATNERVALPSLLLSRNHKCSRRYAARLGKYPRRCVRYTTRCFAVGDLVGGVCGVVGTTPKLSPEWLPELYAIERNLEGVIPAGSHEFG
jgi:hypothetical protein